MAMGNRHSSEQSWGSTYRWHPDRIAKIEVDAIRGSWGSPHRRSPERTAEGEIGISWGPVCPTQVVSGGMAGVELGIARLSWGAPHLGYSGESSRADAGMG